MKILWKNKDDWFINSGDIYLFNNWNNELYKFEQQKISKKTKWSEGLIWSGAFEKIIKKKLKLKSKEPKKHNFWKFSVKEDV